MTILRTTDKDHAISRFAYDVEEWLQNALGSVCGGDEAALQILYDKRAADRMQTDGVSSYEGQNMPSVAARIAAEKAAEAAKPVTSEMVDAEKKRRMNADFSFSGMSFQADHESRDLIDRASIAALAAKAAGKKSGDFRWHGEEVDFEWIASDNRRKKMDADTVLQFAHKMTARTGVLVLKANDLKKMSPIPEDYTDDKWWT